MTGIEWEGSALFASIKWWEQNKACLFSFVSSDELINMLWPLEYRVHLDASWLFLNSAYCLVWTNSMQLGHSERAGLERKSERGFGGLSRILKHLDCRAFLLMFDGIKRAQRAERMCAYIPRIWVKERESGNAIKHGKEPGGRLIGCVSKKETLILLWSIIGHFTTDATTESPFSVL